MNNKNLGLLSIIIVLLTVVIFSISMFIQNDFLSYSICIILSWAYVLMVCSISNYIDNSKKSFAYGSIAFAVIYAIFVDIVYYIQLTAVNQGIASQEIRDILTYKPGSLTFALDLYGYGMMAMSTLLIGIALLPKNSNDKILKVLFMLHGIFLPACVMFPVLNIFSNSGSGDSSGVIALQFWCLYFAITMIFAIKYFIKLPKDKEEI